MNGLDLFSGIGGISLALEDYVRTIGYVEIDKYAQSVLLSRMADGAIEPAPIFRDITRLDGTKLCGSVDIIVGGFPCQDISVAGNGKGLAGERSGLFFEIIRLTKEIRPSFVFLENVPAIRTRGLEQVIKAFTEIGYDCRWTCLSAASVGANHKRERWFLLAHTKCDRGRATPPFYGLSTKSKKLQQTNWKARSDNPSTSRREFSNTSSDGEIQYVAYTKHNGQFATTITGGNGKNNGEKSQRPNESSESSRGREHRNVSGYISDGAISNTSGKGLQRQRQESSGNETKLDYACDDSWWATEPAVGRVANGVPNRVDRIKCLGNSVVPLQVKTAFERLMGINE